MKDDYRFGEVPVEEYGIDDHEPWEDQPVTLPLRIYEHYITEVERLRAENKRVTSAWADTNAKLRAAENEVARLHGALDDALAECRELNAHIDELEGGE